MTTNSPRDSGKRRRALSEGDIISSQIQRLDDGSLVADASGWNQIGHLNFNKNPALNEGEDTLVRILSVGKYGGYAEPVDIVGYIMRVSLEQGSSTATPVDTAYRELVQLDQPAVVSGLADIKITRISGTISGEIQSYDTNPPEIGDRIHTCVEYGAGPHRIQLPNQNCEILLSEDILVTGEIELEITETDHPIRGQICSYCGNLPDDGYTFRVKAERSSGPHRAAPPNKRYPVEVDEDILVDGMIDIGIVEHGLPMRGEIRSHCGNLPEIGHTFCVEAEAGRGPHQVSPPTQNYSVEAEGDILVSGEVEVEITGHGLPMQGKIISQVTDLPEIGDTFSTELEHGQGPHRISPPEEDYFVVINEDILVSGVVEIEMIEHGLPMKGKVKSYCGNLPEIGHTFDAQVTYGQGPHHVSPPGDRFSVVIPDDILITSEIEVEIVDHGLPMTGTISSYCGNLPEIGHTFNTILEDGQGPHEVSSPDECYEVIVEGDVLITDEVEIEIVERGLPMTGRVSSYRGNLPTVGETFDVSLDHGPGEQIIRAPDDRHSLSINEYVLISGQAKVEVTQQDLPMKASIISYYADLPDIGDAFSKSIHDKQHTVQSPDGNFQIELIEKVEKIGTVQIKIVEISDAIYGKIVEYNYTRQNVKSVKSPWTEDRVDNSSITGRKL